MIELYPYARLPPEAVEIEIQGPFTSSWDIAGTYDVHARVTLRSKATPDELLEQYSGRMALSLNASILDTYRIKSNVPQPIAWDSPVNVHLQLFGAEAHGLINVRASITCTDYSTEGGLPRYPGCRLWSHSSTVDLKHSLWAFPASWCSFRALGYPRKAFFKLDWVDPLDLQLSFSQNARILLNADHVELRKSLDRPQPNARALDVIKALVAGEFVALLGERHLRKKLLSGKFRPGSTGATYWGLLAKWFGDPRAGLQMLERGYGEAVTQVQERLELLVLGGTP